MKTRSSRFFVILLHLLGVSNDHLPSWYYDYLTSTTSSERSSFYSGIRGVHPHSIVQERLDLREVGGLDAVDWLGNIGQQSTDRQHSPDTDVSIQANREPFWLQDSKDGQCLGPSGGFSECGDATLWFVLRRGTERKSLRLGPFGVEEVIERLDPEEPYRYALQIVDNDYRQQTPSVHSSTKGISSLALSWRQKRQQSFQRDCLVPSANNGRKFQHESKAPLVELGSCAKPKAAWTWRVDSDGLLYLPKDLSQTKGRQCLRRTKSSSAVLSSCWDEQVDDDDEQQRLVRFSLVRYRTTSSASLSSSRNPSTDHAKPQTMTTSESKKRETKSADSGSTQKDNESSRDGLPSNRDIAHSHASGPVMHSPIFEMNLAGRPLLSNIPSKQSREESNQSPFAALQDSNPILFLGAGTEDQRKNSDVGSTSASASASQVSSTGPVKLSKIEMNPYIAASKNEVWVDPQTGLEYQTDLREFLGHDRKEYGRHTLVGVGQYMKTMLKIKVYGIAFYVSKRDVLAGAAFQDFAGLSAEELRNLPEFYEKLRTKDEDQLFDRTLLLKTNMQLSTETMRSSLDSDWKLLSEEAKKLLIDTSMKPRPAEGQMLEEIQRSDNPSRCSCAQLAPELEADPSCCARGTELVFTWRKNGNLEVRLNGRLMDAFPRSDIGHGIFFEYLRLDDPFSADFLERAVDGFPHLLSPLAQVQGISSPVMQAPPKPSGGPLKAFFKTTADSVSSQAAGIAGVVQHVAGETAAMAAQAAQSAGDVIRHFGEEAEQKRQDVWERMVEMSHQNPAEVFAEFSAQVLAVGEQMDKGVPAEAEPQEVREISLPHGQFFHPARSKWFGKTLDAPDEIGPMNNPTMNKTILSLVHLYLLLILIVSFPPTNSNRTRFVRRSCKMMCESSSESSLIKRITSGRDSILWLKERNQSLMRDHQGIRGSGKNVAPKASAIDTKHAELHPEDEHDPAVDSNVPQRIHIDLHLKGGIERKENSHSKGNRNTNIKG